MKPRTVYSTSSMLPKISKDMLEEAIQGALVIYWHDQKLPLRLTLLERDRFREAQQIGYLYARSGASTLAWAWSYWCEQHELEMIRLQPNSATATIIIDPITSARRQLAPMVHARILRLLEEFALSPVRGGPSYLEVRRVPLAVATKVVETIVAIIRAFERGQVNTAHGEREPA